MPTDTQWLRSINDSGVRHSRIDRRNSVIEGVILAEEGAFKDRRGRFNAAGIQRVVDVAAKSPQGLKSRWTHPTMSNDGLGTFLGRTKNVRLSEVIRDGTPVSVARGDLHLSATSFSSPRGNLGDYVMRLTDEDPDALNMSLVLKAEQEHEIEKDGTAKKGPDGKPMPALWFASALHAVDVVDVGAATNSMLAEELNAGEEDVLAQASRLLVEAFPDKPRAFVEARLKDWCERALNLHWPMDSEDSYRRRLARLRLRQMIVDKDLET